LKFQILGPLELVADDGPVRIRGLRRQLLLANMLVNVGQVVPVERLVDSLWPDDPPPSAVENIRTYVCEIRSQLKAHGDRPRLETYPHAYRLDAEPEELDVLRFNALAAAGEEAVRQGDSSAGVELLGEALGLWRGTPLAGLELSASMEARVAALEERRRSVESKWIKARLALGEHEDVVPTLRAMVYERPLDESLWCMLASALHSVGRREEALTACSDARTALVERLGIEPGPDLKQVQRAVLNGDEPPEPPGQAVPAALAPAVAPSQLPPVCPGFVGRDEELRRIAELIAESEARAEDRVTVIALHGPAGVGKSATALAAATAAKPAFPEGQLYVQLGGSTADAVAPVDALGTLLSGFGSAVEHLPRSLEGRCSLYRSLLADRRMLVVLDDVADGEQLAPLMPGGRNVVILTSRRWLAGTPADANILLGPLSSTESLDMLRGMVGEARVESDAEAAEAITDECGHMPLAVHVAGSRLSARPEHPLRFLADRLSKGSVLDELTVDDLSVRDRYQTSYESLDEESQRCFRTLSFLDPEVVTAPAVADRLGVSVHTADRLLEQLVRQGLLISCAGQPAGEAVEYRLPQVLHAYANELADELAPA
jgi:DNA-binding SARP family transcriptional activator